MILPCHDSVAALPTGAYRYRKLFRAIPGYSRLLKAITGLVFFHRTDRHRQSASSFPVFVRFRGSETKKGNHDQPQRTIRGKETPRTGAAPIIKAIQSTAAGGRVR